MMQIITIAYRANSIQMEENAREKRSTGMLDVHTEYQAQVQWVSRFLVHRGDTNTVPLSMPIVTSLSPRADNLLSAFGPATGNTPHEKREQAPVPSAETWLTSIADWSGTHVYKADGSNEARYTNCGWQPLDERLKTMFCDTQNRLFASVLCVT